MTTTSLLHLCVDLFHFISLYLNIEEFGSLLTVNKFLSSNCFNEDKYWLLRFTTLIVPIQDFQKQQQFLFSQEEHVKKVTSNFLSFLQVPDYLSLYQCLHRFDFPLLGLWGREPRDLAADFRGGLLRIRVLPPPTNEEKEGMTGGSVVAESLSPNGTVVPPCFTVHLLAATGAGTKSGSTKGARCRRLSAVNNFDKSTYVLRKGDSGCLLFEPTAAAAPEGSSSPPSMRFLSLTHDRPAFSSSSPRPSLPSSFHSTGICNSNRTTSEETIAFTLGLYRAHYGPHGFETIHVHAECDANATSALRGFLMF